MSCARPAQAYDSAKQLRYGHLMIMTDQDHDGSPHQGPHHELPAPLLPLAAQVPGFLLEFITPIVKARAPHSQRFMIMASARHSGHMA